MPVHRRVTPSIKFAGTHLYTWVERGTVGVKCLAQEHNTMSPARARNRTARFGDGRTYREATAPPCVHEFTTTTVRSDEVKREGQWTGLTEVRVKNFENNLSDLLSSSRTVLVRSHMKAHVPWTKTSTTAWEIEIFAIGAVDSTSLCESWV